MDKSTNILKKIDPSAQHHVPTSFKWNHNIRTAQNVKRKPVELAPFNHQTFTPLTNTNIISFRLPMDKYADLTDAVIEFNLAAGPVGWLLHKNSKVFIQQLVVELGSERVVYENKYGHFCCLQDYLSCEQDVDMNLNVNGYKDGVKLISRRTERVITADLLTGKFEIPLKHAFFAEKDLPLPHLQNQAIKIDLYLEDPNIVLFDDSAAPVGGTPTYTLSNVLLRYETVVPAMEIQEQHKAALMSSTGLITHHHSYETFSDRMAPNQLTLQTNITTNKGSIAYILIQLRTVNQASLTTTQTDRLTSAALGKDLGIQSLRVKLNGQHHPEIPLDTKEKQYWEIAKIFGKNDKMMGPQTLAPYWERYPNTSGISSGFRAIASVSADYQTRYWDGASHFAVLLADDKNGAISGWDNADGRGQLQMDIKMDAPGSPSELVVDYFVVFDSFVKLCTTKSAQIY